MVRKIACCTVFAAVALVGIGALLAPAQAAPKDQPAPKAPHPPVFTEATGVGTYQVLDVLEDSKGGWHSVCSTDLNVEDRHRTCGTKLFVIAKDDGSQVALIQKPMGGVRRATELSSWLLSGEFCWSHCKWDSGEIYANLKTTLFSKNYVRTFFIPQSVTDQNELVQAEGVANDVYLYHKDVDIQQAQAAILNPSIYGTIMSAVAVVGFSGSTWRLDIPKSASGVGGEGFKSSPSSLKIRETFSGGILGITATINREYQLKKID